jgi:hypothetical protein
MLTRYRLNSSRAAVLFCCSLLVLLPAFGQITQIDGGQTRILTNLQTGSAYTPGPSDCGKLISFSNATGVAVTMPQSMLNNGCWIDIQNTGAGAVTFTAPDPIIDGASGFSLSSNQGLRLVSNGTAYYTQRGQGASSGSGPGSLAIQSGGVSLGNAATFNIVAGTGVSCVPQVNAGVMAFQCNADTSYLATKTNLQDAANPQICTGVGYSAGVHTATCASTLTALAAKQTLYWYPSHDSAANDQINIDTLGPVSLVKQDGSDIGTAAKASTLYRIWYDGAKFRVVEAGLGGGSSSSSENSGSSNVPFVYTQGYKSAAMTGSPVVIYSTPLPALAAGACYHIEFVSGINTGGAAALNLDGTTLWVGDAGMSGDPYISMFNIELCNDQSTQSAQHIIPTWTTYSTITGGGWSEYGGSSPLISSAAFDMSVPHTLNMTLKSASGIGTGYFMRIN